MLAKHGGARLLPPGLSISCCAQCSLDEALSAACSAVTLRISCGVCVSAGKLTNFVGKALAGFPVEPWMGKVLLAGAGLGCAQEALAVVAMAATDPVWLTPRSAPQAHPSSQHHSSMHTCAPRCCNAFAEGSITECAVNCALA